jgi:hypothetical protein
MTARTLLSLNELWHMRDIAPSVLSGLIVVSGILQAPLTTICHLHMCS